MRILGWLVLLATGVWLLQPALDPVHVEGFSASIVALGLHLPHGSVTDFMPFAALSTDYFGLTKFGAVLGVAMLSPVFGGDGSMRLLMHGGLALALLSSAYLIRRWTGARWWIVVATLLIVPGSIEAGFYFNDNVPAAALLLAGLALLERWRSVRVAALAGILIGGAISIRIDMVAVAVVAVPLIAWEKQNWRKTLLTCCAAGLAAVIAVFGIFATVGVTPFDAIRVGIRAVNLWARPLSFLRQGNELLFFWGLPGFFLALLGIMQLVRERRWGLLALLAGVPLAFNLAFLGTLWQARQFMALTPFLCGLTALAAEAALADFKAGRRLFPAILGAFALVILGSPVRAMLLSDGPHEHVGRLAGIAIWKDWQAQIRQDFDRIDQLVASVPGRGPLVVLTDGWNDDRYLHLRLIESGYEGRPLPPVCRLLGSGFRKGDGQVVQLTLQAPFIQNWSEFQRRRLTEAAMPCVQAFPSARLVFLAQRSRLATLMHLAPDVPAMRPELKAAGMDPIVAVPLEPGMLAALEEGYRRSPLSGYGTLRSMEEAQAAVASQTAFSR